MGNGWQRLFVPLALGAVLAVGCASTDRRRDREAFEVFTRDADEIDRVLAKARKTGKRDPVAVVPQLLELRRPMRSDLTRNVAAFDELLADLAVDASSARGAEPGDRGLGGGGYGGGAAVGDSPTLAAELRRMGVLQTFSAVPEGAGRRRLEMLNSQCISTFCAGVGATTLDPSGLAVRPRSPFLRALTGRSHPPLAGYFDRVRKSGLGLGILWRLLFRDQYYAHLFKDHEPPMDEPPIMAKALVLRDENGKTFYWVKTDLIGAFQDLRSTVLKKLHDRGINDVGEENFLLHGTHAHSGLGALSPRWLPMVVTVDLWVLAVYELVADRIVAAVEAARADLRPAKLGTGETHIDHVTRNRRKVCANDPKNTDPDPTAGIIKIVEAGSGEPLATVFNFAIHGTSLGGDNLTLHPDNMGYAERYIEDPSHYGGTALFFNGTQGDVKPVGHASDIGCAVGTKVVEALDSIETTDEVLLRSAFCHLNDPFDSRYLPACSGKLERFQLRPKLFSPDKARPGCFVGDGTGTAITIDKGDDPAWLDRQGAVLAAYRIDHETGSETINTLLLTLPGEPITDIGGNIRTVLQTLQYEHVWIVGLSNAHMGYIVTESEYMQGGYESGANFFGPTEGQVFTDIAADLAAKLPPL